MMKFDDHNFLPEKKNSGIPNFSLSSQGHVMA